MSNVSNSLIGNREDTMALQRQYEEEEGGAAISRDHDINIS